MSDKRCGQEVRIKQYNKNHPNAFARVEAVSDDGKTVRVSNMNMPYAGTFAYTSFSIDDVIFTGDK